MHICLHTQLCFKMFFSVLLSIQDGNFRIAGSQTVRGRWLAADLQSVRLTTAFLDLVSLLVVNLCLNVSQ